MNRRIPAFITVALTLMASLVFASPASATELALTPHDEAFNAGQLPAQSHGADTPLTTSAISANGERVVIASNARDLNGCSGNTGDISVTVGTTTSTATSWQAPLAIPLGSSLSCGLARDLKISLSDDGTMGLVSWYTVIADPITQLLLPTEVRFATFNWPVGEPAPLQINMPQTFITSGVAYKSQALSADGSRAIVTFEAWSDNDNGYWPYYAVIDTERPEFTRLQTLKTSPTAVPFEVAPTVPAVISADGEVIAMATYRRTGNHGLGAFRELNVYTCTALCYPNKLKNFSANLPTNQGGASLNLDINDSGSRVAVTWTRTPDVIPGVIAPPRALRMLLVNPLTATSAPSIVTSQVKYLNNIELEYGMFDMSSDGTRFVVATTKPSRYVSSATGTAKVTLGTISAAGAVAVTKVSPIPMVTESTNRVTITGAPERVFLTYDGDLGSKKILVSDSISLNYWSVIHSVDRAAAGLNFAVSRSASRAVSAIDQDDYQQHTTSPLVTVTNIRNVLGVKVAPTISGTASLGKALTVKNGSWNATGTFTYQWLRDGEVLSGENDSTYVPEQADAGHRLSVTLRHQKIGYYDTFFTSAGTAVVTGGFMSGVFVQLSGLVGGVPKVGTALGLTCSWTPSGGTLSYSWKVGGKVVATTPNYAPRASDVGKTVTVTQTQVKTGFTTASVSFTSGPTAR